MRWRNYRLFLTGQLFSTTGSWVQRIAQDWLVLSITGSTTAVGVTTALQFLPAVLFGMAGGWIADRWPKRRILLITQAVSASSAAALAYFTLSDQVTVWHVYAAAFLLGTAFAVDYPTRQALVNEMVGPGYLRNAICLNSSAFHTGALIGPAVSGFLIEHVGPGYSFGINALSYLAPTAALLLIRADDLREQVAVRGRGGQLRGGLRYIAGRRDMWWPILLVASFALFTANLPVTLAAFAKTEFHVGAGGYGLFSTLTAVGALTGALLSAARARTTQRTLFVVGGVLALLYVVASLATNQWMLSLLLVPIGAMTVLLNTSANATVQIAAADHFRGRVMGVYLVVFIGCEASGGPLVGGINELLGPHYALLTAGVVPATATVLIWFFRRATMRVPRAGT